MFKVFAPKTMPTSKQEQSFQMHHKWEAAFHHPLCMAGKVINCPWMLQLDLSICHH